MLNHFIVPAVIYFMSCWRPFESHLKQLNQLASNFLWGGKPNEKKIHKVAYSVCTLSKSQGGIGLMDVSKLGDKLASK